MTSIVDRKRKIVDIQFQVTDSFTKHLCVLCDDGTVWTYERDGWERVADIPQDEE